jgi:predicted RNase H-like HicB family nuclease
MELTAVYVEAEEGGYVGFVEELPGANTQGETLEEARENLKEVVALLLESNRQEAEKLIEGEKFRRETIEVPAA